MTIFRLSAHKLAIEAGSFQKNITIEQRLCIICYQRQNETKFHVLLICPKYMELIKSLIINYKFVPTLNQVHKNMSTNNVQSQLNLVKYIDKAMYVQKNCN